MATPRSSRPIASGDRAATRSVHTVYVASRARSATRRAAAVFPCADLELTLQPREDHAAYIAHWLTILQNDKRATVRATAHAQRAADYLHRLQPPALERAA